MACQFDIREPSIEALESAPVYFRYGSNKNRVLVDAITAGAVLAVYRAVNEENKTKLARMVAGSFTKFERVVAFSMKHVNLKGAA